MIKLKKGKVRIKDEKGGIVFLDAFVDTLSEEIIVDNIKRNIETYLAIEAEAENIDFSKIEPDLLPIAEDSKF